MMKQKTRNWSQRAGMISLVLLLLLAVPSAIAQEPTGEPTPDPVAEDVTPTEVPVGPEETTSPTAPPTDASSIPDPEETVDPTEEPIPTETVTEESGIEPTDEASTPEFTIEPVQDVVFFEDFSGEELAWTLDGWVLTSTDEETYLAATQAGATASPDDFTVADVELSARLRVTPGNTLSVVLRAGDGAIRVMFDAFGNSRLYVGPTLVTASSVIDASEDEPDWFVAQVIAVSNTVIVKVNGVQTLAHTDAMSTTAGPVTFLAGESNTAEVAINDISALRLDASEVIAVPAPIVIEPDVPAETPTGQPADIPGNESEDAGDEDISEESDTAETEGYAGEETLDEATEPGEDAGDEAEDDETATTSEEAPIAPSVIAYANFDGPTVGWTSSEGASVITAGTDNLALLMSAGSTFGLSISLPATFEASAGFDLLSEDGLLVSLGEETTLIFSAEGITASTGEEAPVFVETHIASHTWQMINVVYDGTTLIVGLNGEAVVGFSAEGLTQFTFTALGNVMLDDVSLTDLAPTSVAAPAPEVIASDAETTAEALNAKASMVLGDILALYQSGAASQAFAQLAELGVSIDENARVKIIIWVTDSAAVAARVTNLGGEVIASAQWQVEAFIGLDRLGALATDSAVTGLDLPILATPTGPIGTNRGNNFGNAVLFESFDVLGLQEWHLAGVTGTGIDVAVIDSGFTGITNTGDLACVGSTASQFGGLGTGNHGLNAMEVICDVAPGSRVFAYTASDTTSLAQAISAARLDGRDVILITLDLGAAASPGDGTIGVPGVADSNNPYVQIELARNAGIPVIVAAGNNDGRYVSFNYNGTGPVNVTLNVMPNSRINTSWNNWSTGTGKPTVSVSGAITGNNGAQGPNAATFLVPSANCNPGPCAVTVSYSGGGQALVVQLQVTGEGASVTSTPGGIINHAGNLGRPADSPFAIAVGALCSSYQNNFGRMSYSSRGPVYAAGGAEPTVPPVNPNYSISQVKPNVMSLSHVYTSRAGLASNSLTGCANGFGGTSAAASHVAGMAALLKANTTNVSMNSRFNSGGIASINNLRDYLGTRSVDMPFGINADGYDMLYGAGLSTLGSPFYNLADSTATYPDADAFRPRTAGGAECDGGILYVGQNAPGLVANGTVAQPYAHVAFAIRRANANNQCVIVLPGEYTTSLLFQDNPSSNEVYVIGYNEATGTPNPPSIFWINAMYYDSEEGEDFGPSKLYFQSDATAYTVSGLTFVATRIFGETESGKSNELAQIAIFDGARNATLRNNSMGEAILNGVTHPYRVLNNVPILVITSTDTLQKPGNIRILDNTFLNIIKPSINGGALATTLYVENADNNTQPVIFRGNEVRGHRNRGEGVNTVWSSILYSESSYIQIVNNRFVDNEAETLLQLRTSSQTAPEYGAVLGNVFLNNRTVTNDPSSNPGPLINLYHVRNFSLINNTIVNNTITTSTVAGALIMRGDPTLNGTLGEGNQVSDLQQTYDIYNNIIYSNTFSSGLVTDTINSFSIGSVGYTGLCRSLAGVNDQGFRNNWVFGNVTGLIPLGGACASALLSGANENLTVNPEQEFLGFRNNNNVDPLDDLDPLFDPIYYSLYQKDDLSFSIGIDGGNQTLSTFLTTLGPDNRPVAIPFDVGGNNDRIIDVAAVPGVKTIDIGAYEFSPLTIFENDVNAGAFMEDSGIYTFNLFFIAGDGRPNVRGGFGALSFRIADEDPATNNEFPVYFGTHCGPQFTNANRGIVVSGGIVSYCPARHFYTDNGNVLGSWPNELAFRYEASDEGGAKAYGNFRFTINPTADNPLNTPLAEPVTKVGPLSQPNIMQLLPYPRFTGGNFAIVGLQNDEADYLYLYDQPVIDNSDVDCNDGIFDQATLNTVFAGVTATGRITFPAINTEGCQRFIYRVRDSGGNPVVNSARLRVVSQIPTRGLHDDTSFVWTYRNGAGETPGSWVALNSPNLINNTLHQTNVVDDRAEFSFFGTGFVLYMGFDSLGANWQLRIDGIQTGNWNIINPADPVTSPRIYSAVAGPFTCYTQVVPDTIETNLLTSRGALNTGFTVECQTTGASAEHDVAIINRQQGRRLNVDAFSIITDGVIGNDGPLGPGFHDFAEFEVRNIFGGQWEALRDTRASNGILYATLPGLATANDVVFRFTDGSGFALGTVLDRFTATYTICVQDMGINGMTPGNSICQDFNDSPDGTATRLTYNAFRPFFGFTPSRIYEVTIRNITLDASSALSRFRIDSIVVFQDVAAATLPLEIGTTEDDQIAYFTFEGGVKDSWTFDYGNVRYSNNSLTSVNPRVAGAGPFVSFKVPDTVDTLYWNYNHVNRESRQLMICVDRAVGTAGANDRGNCILVNTRPDARFNQPSYHIIDTTTGDLLDPRLDANKRDVAIPNQGLIIIEEDMFDVPWAGTGTHTIEVFSLSNELFNLDKVAALSSTGAFQPGSYEEITSLIRYFTPAGIATDTSFEPVPYDRIANNFVEPFTLVTGTLAARDSGRSVVHTSTIGSAIYFRIEGTGFAPHFRLDRDSDAVRICWLAGNQPVAAVLNAGNTNCQVLDNESARVEYNAPRPILGLAQGEYSVAIEMLPDNQIPRAHTRPLLLWFDGVTVYGEDWTSLTPLTTGVRNEGSFVNRVQDNKFLYYGARWLSRTGPQAARQSGGNFDLSTTTMGSSVVFTVNGADTIIFYRDLSRAFANLLVCAAPITNPLDRKCTEISNDGAGFQREIAIYLNDTGTPGNFVVSMSSITFGNWVFDAIEPVITGVLQPGKYDDTNPSIRYDDGFINVIVNGDMEADSNWTGINTTFPDGNIRSSALRYLNSFTRRVITSGAGGIESEIFSLVTGDTYDFVGRVAVDAAFAGQLSLQLLDANTDVVIAQVALADRVDASNTTIARRWQPMRFSYTATGPDNGRTVKLRVASTAAGTFYVDDVQGIVGGKWRGFYNNAYYNGTLTRSLAHGSQATFRFQGTGFAIGTVQDLQNGQTEICYGIGTPNTCMIYQSERAATSNNMAYTVAGLPNGTYTVRIREVDNGFTVNGTRANETRQARFNVASLAVDFVEIFGNPRPPTITNSINANDDLLIGGQRALQLLPADRWLTQTGRPALRASGETYATLADALGRETRLFGGGMGLITLDLDSGADGTDYDEATVVLYTTGAVALASDQLLICVDGVDGRVEYDNPTRTYSLVNSTRCTLTSALRTTSQIAVNKDVLPLLGTPTGINGQDRVLLFTTLSPGDLKIDGFQVFYDTVLTPGRYEDVIGKSILVPDINANWNTTTDRLFSGGTALTTSVQGAASDLVFNLGNSTGFSFVSKFEPNGGNIQFTVVDTATGGTNYNDTFVVSTQNARATYGIAFSYAGLPLGNYTVTVRNLTATNLHLDAIEVYGELQQLGSLYDDAQVSVNGVPLLTFGPTNAWTANEGARARGYLNETNHFTNSYGATVSFEVGSNEPAIGITLFYGTPSNSKLVDVCWTNLPAGTPQCNSVDLSDRAGRKFVAAPAPGNYAVSIINQQVAGTIFLDAIQVMETVLAEGIYDVPFLSNLTLPNGLVNVATDPDVFLLNLTAKTARLGALDYVQFVFRGIGFSTLMNESTATAGNYQVCVAAGNVANPTLNCNVVNQIVNRVASPVGPFALTYAGLHTGGGNGVYTVRITNTTPAIDRRFIEVTEVHVMGANNDLKINGATDKGVRIENDDPRIRYLPFGGYLNEVDRLNRPSAGNQHKTLLRGGGVYFEFQGAEGFEYVRQTARAFNNAEVCVGRINIDTLVEVTCTPAVNTTADAYQVSSPFVPNFSTAVPATPVDCTTAPGCWVLIRADNTTRRNVTFDFTRLFNTSDPLVAGKYEETYSGLYDFRRVSTGPDTYEQGLAGTLPLNVTPAFASPRASGGFVRRYVGDGGNSALFGGTFFTFEGTGFSVGFNRNTFADEVRICYAPFNAALLPLDNNDRNTLLNNLLTGGGANCVSYDNYSRAVLFAQNHTIVGLPHRYYAVAVQMMPDNGIPVAHTIRELPLAMELDSITIYDNLWFDPAQTNWTDNTYLNALAPGQRYETSFVNRTQDKNFLYYGSAWRSFSGRAAVRYSGSDYDEIREQGASIVFRTRNANAVILYTRTLRGNSPLLFCATPVNPANPLVASGPSNCQEIGAEGLGFYAQALSFSFGGPVDEYVVSITSLSNGSFQPDAIEVVDTTQPLTAGKYESTFPAIQLNTNWANTIANGNFETAPGAGSGWNTVGGATVVHSTVRFEGLRSYQITGNGGAGIASQLFDLVPGESYTLIARVRTDRGGMSMQLSGATASPIVITRTPLSGQWFTLRQDFIAGANATDLTLNFVATAPNTLFFVDDVSIAQGGRWIVEYNARYSESSIVRSQTDGASFSFQFFGTGFELGMLEDTFGGEVEVCYGTGTPDTCFIYQQENPRLTLTSSRIVAGLPQNTYNVRVRDVEDGFTITRRNSTTANRALRFLKPGIGLDYVRIFDEAPAPAVGAGYYNENATIGGQPILQLLPAQSWGSIEGRLAARFSEQSYSTLILNNRATNAVAGPAALLNVNVPNTGDGSAVILYTGRAVRTNSGLLLICAGPRDTTGVVMSGAITWDGTNLVLAGNQPGDCVLKSNMQTEDQIVVNKDDLTALGTPGVQTLMFTTLQTGFFNIDGFQIIEGTLLSPGVHEDFLPDNLLNFETPSTSVLNRTLNPRTCNNVTEWCLTKDARAYNLQVAYTRGLGNRLTFDFAGTGFSLLTRVDTLGVDFRICYVPLVNGAPLETIPQDNAVYDGRPDPGGIPLNNVWCDTVTSNTTPAQWTARNLGRVNPRSASQYGFSYYGLPQGEYQVEVRIVDTTIGPRDGLAIDAVVVFDDIFDATPLVPGFYDDTAGGDAISYEPSVFWTTTTGRLAPPRGPLNFTETTTRSAGAIVQMYIDGNAMILYQTINTVNTSDAAVCLTVSQDETVHCSPAINDLFTDFQPVQVTNFSQRGRRTFAVPIMFYGLGVGEHRIIIENREPLRNLSIDGIRVLK